MIPLKGINDRLGILHPMGSEPYFNHTEEIIMSALASRFSRNRVTFRSDSALSDDQLRAVAPSIFAEHPHDSRSERYAYIATAEILARLRKEGFQPFMVAQTKVRDDSRREHTKHMLRLRHPSQINGTEANEIIVLNSHDGSSAFQLLSGCFRFVCANGMVCGDINSDIRVPHKGDVVDRVVSGAFEVLDGFTRVVEDRESMKGVTLEEGEQAAFGKAAIALRYDTEVAPAPITERQVLSPRRAADNGSDLWTTFNRVQENLIRGGLPARSARGVRTRTREVAGIDQGVKLNRALWVLANEMRKLRG